MANIDPYLKVTDCGHLVFGSCVFHNVSTAEVLEAVADLVEVDGTVGLGRKIPRDSDGLGIVTLVYSHLPGSASGDVPEGLVDDGIGELALASSRHNGDANLED